ncbi:MAG TPA: PaaI family thioesterase [Thermoleophilaceae bacterium]|nr:PaaI family thioesterase [Thermoleophilaceae bacterium]
MDRSMIVSWEDPEELGEQARTMRGLSFLEAIRDEELPPAPIQRLLDFTLTEVEEGRVVFTATPGEQHYNPIGVVHGGLAATLLDSAMGAAVHSTLPEGQGYTTLETKFNLVRAITADTGPIQAEGKVVNRGRQVATAEGYLRDGAGKLLAHGTSTCLVIGG